jgi:hypothetical protein
LFSSNKIPVPADNHRFSSKTAASPIFLRNSGVNTEDGASSITFDGDVEYYTLSNKYK